MFILFVFLNTVNFLAGIPPPATAGAPLVVDTLFLAEGLRRPKHRSLQGSAQVQVGQNGLRGRKEAKVLNPAVFVNLINWRTKRKYGSGSQ